MEVIMDLNKISEGIRLVLEGIGEDISREGLTETPKRVAEMFQEILQGIHQEPHLTAGISEEVSDDLIVIRDIPFYSMCEHHLLPFFGKIHIAYIPQSNKVTGFSSLTRLVDVFAHRLQIQERLTRQIADAIMDFLNPKGVLVFVEAQQLCVSMRGSKKDAVRTVTKSVKGDVSSDCLEIFGLKPQI
jgi:GTP cyclohydrolase I